MKQQLAKQVYDLYKRSLNHKSKWYNNDLADFKALVQTKTVEQLRQQLANMRGIMGLDEQLNRVLAAEKNLVLMGENPSDLYYKERELFAIKLSDFLRTDWSGLNGTDVLKVCSLVGTYRPVALHSFLIRCAQLIND